MNTQRSQEAAASDTAGPVNAGGGGGAPDAERLVVLLQQQLERLYTDPDPQRKAAANSWLLEFQRSSAAWAVCRLLLQQEQPQLQLAGAQTLAWKIDNEGHLLQQAHKEELSAALFATVRQMQQHMQEQQHELSYAVGGRLGHCFAALAFQTIGESQLQQHDEQQQQQHQHQHEEQQQQEQQRLVEPLRQLLAFGSGERAFGGMPSSPADGSNSSTPLDDANLPLTWSCWISLAALAAIPCLLRASDLPSRGARRLGDGAQGRAVALARHSVLTFGSRVLAAASAAASAAAKPSTAAAALAARGGRGSSGVEARCGEGALVLLTAWLDGAETADVPVSALCCALGEAVSPFFLSIDLTDCLVAALPRLPAFMALWGVQPAPGAIEAFWGAPSMPAGTPEGSLLQRLLVAFQQLSQQVEEDLVQLQQHARSTETATLIRWGGVLLTMLEGHPQLLLLPGAAAAGSLLLLLWRANPLTWLRVSAFWAQVKDMRRDGLLQQDLLQQLATAVSPCCVSALLQHSRRSNPCWMAEGAAEWAPFMEAAGDVLADLFALHEACGEKQGHAFLLSLSALLRGAVEREDVCEVESVLLLLDAIIEALNHIPQSLAGALLLLQRLPQQQHVAVAAALLLRKAAIHFTEDPEYDGLQSCLSRTACCSLPLLATIWLVALRSAARLLLLHPPLLSDAMLQLTTWGGHHLGVAALEDVEKQEAAVNGGAPSSAAPAEAADIAVVADRRLQQLRELRDFVAAVAPQQLPLVDGTLHASIVKLLQHFLPTDMACLFCQLLQETAEGIRSSSVNSSCSSANSGTALFPSARHPQAARLLARLDCCAAALFSGRVEVSRGPAAAAAAGGSNEVSAASDCFALLLLRSPKEQAEFLRQHAAGCYLFQQQQQPLLLKPDTEDTALWVYLLQLVRDVLLHCASTLPTGGASRERLSFSQLIDLRARLPQQQQQQQHQAEGGYPEQQQQQRQQQQETETGGDLFVRALRCLRLLLAVLGSREDAQDMWGAVITTVESCIAAAAAKQQQHQGGAAAAAIALQGSCIVLLSDLLRITAATPPLQRLVRQRIAHDAAAALELYVCLSHQLPPDMADAYVPLLEFLSAHASAWGPQHQQQLQQGGAEVVRETSFFESLMYEQSLLLCSHILRGDDAEVAKRCLGFLYVCCCCCPRRQRQQQMERQLHQLVPAVLGSLGVWGIETLAVLWKVFAQWGERYNSTLLLCVSSWLRESSTSSGSGSSSRSPLQQLEPVQQQLLLHCLEVFRGPRIRQLLQDMCLIAAGVSSPADALVAYEFALHDSGAARHCADSAATAAVAPLLVVGAL
ncbi:uncharacterized protein LOC113146809 [Cyclospora cayetanensis]|uniref:Uncharacterized protein LOC113146809 n=1 Tax=Cyclospora cayetanensis TaxID=88456 RepID=A0A6P6RT80_9EIME|nr:uncharacterized protein LOC113146809 [Cyclospora cayetanensis]